MHLLRWRPTVRTVRLELPDGTVRAVKVTTNDMGTTQHVEDWADRTHGTGRPIPIRIEVHHSPRQRKPLLLRNLGMPKLRQAFSRHEDTGPWVPVPGTEQPR